MPTITQHSTYAQAALASYAASLVAGANNTARYKDQAVGMTDTQATAFDRDWAVLQQYTSTNGFSAVLLQRKDDAGNATGEKVLAIAGTDPSSPADVITDVVNVFQYGTAAFMPQYVSLESFYVQLVSSGKVGATEQITVTGHSLGGFLAQAFTARHTNVVSAAFTYNAPGFGTIELLLGFLGITDAAGASAKITNVHATDGWSVTAGLGWMLGASQPVRIEADPNPLSNHSIVNLGDVLAIYAAYAQLDAGMTMEKAANLFVSSGTGTRRLEDALDALRTVFVGSASNDANKTPTGNRDAFFNNLVTMTSGMGPGSFQALAGQVQLVPVGSSFASLAQEETAIALAYRYALVELQPFAVVANTEEANQTLYGYYSSRLSLYNDQTGQGELTNSWIDDRAMLLKDILQINSADTATGIVTDATLPRDRAVELRYFEQGSQQSKTLTAHNPTFNIAGNTSARQLISFGSDIGDVLNGITSRFGDHIYGGGGNDTISGLAGDDYLEGNAADDNLQGDDGNDVVLGGAGNDTLDGGKDIDTLKGGQGNDIYILRAETSDVTDTIIDSDGLGSIKVYGSDGSETILSMSGGKKLADGTNIWQSQDQRFTFTLIADSPTANTLRIDGAGVKALVRNFTSGNLGIDLPGAAAVPANPTTNLTILGDLEPVEPLGYDELDNVITTNVAAPDRTDTLFDSTGDDKIDAGGGADLVTGLRGGNDWIGSAEGDDVVFEYGGDDLIELGAGRDLGYGGAGKDRIYGRTAVGFDVVLGQTVAAPATERDIIDGGSGDDTLVGDAAADALFGADGKDVILGGAGDDNMFGDRATSKTLYGIADVQRVETYDAQGNLVSRSVVFTALEHELPQVQDADLMLGGAGADMILGDGGDDYLDGGLDNDYVAGGAGADALLGAEGDDVLDGDGEPVGAASLGYVAPEFHGNDFLDGGAGDDKLLGGGGDDELFGSEGADRLSGDNSSLDASFHGDDYLDGGAGTDTLVGEGGDDQLVGGSGDDVLSGDATDLVGSSHGKDYLDGGDGADLMFGDGGDDELFGGEQDDALWGDSDILAAQYHGHDYLDGEGGNDQLVGSAGNDQLFGGADDDNLFGDDDAVAEALHGDDYIDGEDGNDYLRGYGGKDVLIGGSGDDTLIGEASNDTLEGGTGWDLYSGGAGDDTYVFNAGDTNGLALAEFVDDSEGVNHIELNGMSIDGIELWATTDADIDLIQSGNDAIFVRGLRSGAIGTVKVNGTTYSAAQFFGNTYAWPIEINTATPGSALQGGKESDTLVATGGNSTLAGGLGNDTLVGSGGGNTYVYTAGDGHDSITDTSSPDQAGILRFGTGVSAQDIRLSHANGDLVLAVANDPPGSVRIGGFDAGDAMKATGVNRFEFADGTVLSHAELVARGFDIQGGEGSDLLQGTNLADRLTGKAGNDTLSGRGGDDVYTFNIGDAADTIADADTALGANDVLVLGDYISPYLVHVGRQGNDLLLDLTDLGGADQITLRDYFVGGADAVEHIRFADGTNWTQADVLALLSSGTNGDDTITGSAGDDLLTGGRGNDTLTGLAGNDTLSGGPGTDTIDGGTGDDVYLFNLGDGSDTVLDGGGIDVLRLGAGIAPANTSIHDTGKDLILRIGTGGDQVTLHGYLAASPNAELIETIEFEDHTTWTLANVLDRRLAGTSGDDNLIGFDRDDSIDAFGGNDIVHGGAGADTLRGGEGSDQLFGQAGNDVYVVYPQGGTDVLSEAGGGVAGDVDKLLFAGGLLQADFTFAQEGMDLLATSASKGVAVRVVNQFAELENSNGVEVVEFSDGSVLDRAALRRLLSAPTNGDDQYTGDDTSEAIDALAGNDTVYARGGDDVLRGNTGADALYGGAGNDIYDYRPGDGQDIVDDQDPVTGGSGIDTLQLGAGINPSAVSLVRSGDNLMVNTGSAGDTVTINGYYSRGDFERITFSNGTSWNQEDIAAKLPINGTAGADTLIGTAAADLIDGGAGNDTIRGGRGNDTLRGGTDSSKTYYEERLYGEEGDDVLITGNKPAWLYGGAGNDILMVAPGSSTDAYDFELNGGDGNDLLIGSASKNGLSFNQTGNNIIIGGKGDDSYATHDYIEGDPLPLGRNLLLYNTGDGNELHDNDNRYVSTNDIVSIGLTKYSQLALSGGVGYSTVGLASGRDTVAGAYYDPVPERNDTKYVQIIVSARDYSAASADPLRNRKVVVIDIEAWGREFYATVTANRNYDLLAALRRHIAWSSDTLAFGGKIAYEYGAKGNIDAVSLSERRAIMADPNLNLLGQPISGSQLTALALAESPDLLTNSSALLMDSRTETHELIEKRTLFQTPLPAPDLGRFAIDADASPLPIRSPAAWRRQAETRRYSLLPPMNDEPAGESWDSRKIAESIPSGGDSSPDLLPPLSAGALPALRACELQGHISTGASGDARTEPDRARSLPADRGLTSTASGLWAQVDAWVQLEQTLMAAGTDAPGSDHWESTVIGSRLATGLANAGPEPMSLIDVVRLERVASFGLANLAA